MIHPMLYLCTSIALVVAVNPPSFEDLPAMPSEETLKEVQQFIEEINQALVAKETAEAMSNVRHEAALNPPTPIQGSPKCKSCTTLASSEATPTLSIYMSFSIPAATWKEYSDTLKQIGGVFVLRGLPDNSFEAFSTTVKKFRVLGIDASIRLDPEAFEKHNIQEVPALILEEGNSCDKVVGNQRIEDSLRLIIEKGTAHQSAEKILKKLRPA